MRTGRSPAQCMARLIRHLGCICPLLAILSGGVTGAESRPSPRVAGILKLSGVSGGLCVRLGVTDGRLTAELGACENLLVQGLVGSEKSLAAARAHIRAKGLYGRVSASLSDHKHLPYAENLVNLMVAEDLEALIGKGLPPVEIARALAPDGVLCARGVPVAKLKSAGLATVGSAGGWTALRKPRPDDMDEWTHWRYGPAGNAVSRDRVGVPCSLRWQAGPLYQTGGHYYGGGAPVSAGGRLFTVTLEERVGPAGRKLEQVLWCRDAHSGVLLWRRPTASRRPEFAGNRRPLVAGGDRLYAVMEDGGPLLALDAASGETITTYEQAVDPDDWMLFNDSLIVRRTPDRGKNRLLCLDAAGGGLRWQKEIRVTHMVAAKERIFCLTAEGKTAKSLLCIEARNGAEKWRAAAGSEWGQLLCCFKGVLIFGSGSSQARKGSLAGAHGVSADDGKHLWSFRYGLLNHGGRPSKVYCVDGLVWVNRAKPGGWVGLDPETGQERRFHKEAAPCWSRNLCADNRATERFILTRTMLFVDVKSGEYLRPWGVKNGCAYGSILPANGLIYTFPNQCRCYPMLRGIIAMGDTVPPLKNGAGRRLRRGPAFGFGGPAGNGKGGWPTYRSDPQRSAAASGTVPADARLLWTSAMGGTAPPLWKLEWERRGGGHITAPTAAGGRVFVARSQAHEVLALNAADGKPAWRFSTGGRVDVPPTLHRGLCLFGSADGWVYCLKADDGREVWRFRAAPTSRSVVAFGQLESAWPVRGGVLVADGVAYATAGRHSKIDGGAFVHALDPASGKVLWSKNPGDYHGLADVMVAGGKSVCFASRHYDHRTGSGQFDPRTGATRPRAQRADDFLSGNTGLLSEMWTGTLYHGSRLSVWTRGKTAAQMMVFSNGRTYGFRAGDKSPACVFSADAEGKAAWKTDVPRKDRGLLGRCAKAMALTGDVLWAAGRLSADSDREVLRAYSAADGRQLREIPLEAPVVYDGLAAAGNRLYVSCRDGKLHCYGTR